VCAGLRATLFDSLVARPLRFELGLRSLGQFTRALCVRQDALVPRIPFCAFSLRQLLLRHLLPSSRPMFVSVTAMSLTLKSRERPRPARLERQAWLQPLHGYSPRCALGGETELRRGMFPSRPRVSIPAALGRP